MSCHYKKFIIRERKSNGSVEGMIRKEEICNLNHVMNILNDLREYVSNYEEIFGELPEENCVNIEFQLFEIDEFIVGAQLYSNTNIAMRNIRIMLYWDYIEGKCDFLELVKGLKQYEGDIRN